MRLSPYTIWSLYINSKSWLVYDKLQIVRESCARGQKNESHHYILRSSALHTYLHQHARKFCILSYPIWSLKFVFCHIRFEVCILTPNRDIQTSNREGIMCKRTAEWITLLHPPIIGSTRTSENGNSTVYSTCTVSFVMLLVNCGTTHLFHRNEKTSPNPYKNWAHGGTATNMRQKTEYNQTLELHSILFFGWQSRRATGNICLILHVCTYVDFDM
jgi:hypothetical protein